MANVGDSAYTDYGQGEIREIDSRVRGGKQFRVAGRGFDVWVPETQLRIAKNPWGAPYNLQTTIEQGEVNHRPNTYPYDPTPQYPVDMFRREQTIQPGDHKIDPDERLHPSKAYDHKRTDGNRPYPGPAPDLFAKGAALHGFSPDDWEQAENHDPTDAYRGHPDSWSHKPTQADYDAWDAKHKHAWTLNDDSPEDEEDRWAHFNQHAHDTTPNLEHFSALDPEDEGDSFKEWGDDEWHADLPDGPERTFGKDAGAHHLPGDADYADFEQPRYSGGRHEAWEPQNGQGPNHGGYYPGKPVSVPNTEERGSTQPARFATYRPAGLSTRYAHVHEAVDHRDPITAFVNDPIQFMEARAYQTTYGDMDRLAALFSDEDALLATSKQMRTAAWKDVRQKAQRLRREGAVQVNHVTPQHIYATVKGDNGVYDTMIVKGASGAFTGGQQIANWYCDCDWGKWAFKRKLSYVGRLCSHAYAAYLDMQSHYQKGNDGKFKAASRRRADVVSDFKKWADENNDGHWDHGSIADYINTCHDQLSRDDVAKLYEHLDKNVQVAPERNYDVDYTLDNEKAYKKEADVQLLRQRPLSLTPDLRTVEKNPEHDWQDVTEDERETTGPDQIMREGSYSAIAAMLHHADTDPAMVSQYDVNHGAPNPAPANPPSPGPSFSLPKTDPSSMVTQYDVNHGAPNPAPANPPSPGGAQPVSADETQYQMTHGGPRANPSSAVTVGNPDGHTNVSNPGNVTKQQVLDAFKPPAAAAPGAPNTNAPAVDHVPGINEATPRGGGVFTPDATSPGNGAGAGPNGTQGSGQGYGGAGYQSGGGWNKSNETSHINNGQYTVKPGDTLSDIAGRSGLSVNELASQNHIADPNKINSGQALNIGKPASPAGGAPAAPAATPSAPKSVTNTPADGGLFNSAIPQVQTPQLPKPPTPPGMKTVSSLTARLHMAADSDDGDDNEDKDERPDTGEVAHDLERLRELGAEPQSEHYQHMDDHNEEIRRLVEELNDAGVDAMPFVASQHFAKDDEDSEPEDFSGGFMGQSYPNWADEPFVGSGPDPKLWMQDSASYVDDHERPDFIDLTDNDGDDIIKYNNEPQQGPRHGSHRHADGVANGNTLGDFAPMEAMDAGSGDPLAEGASMAGTIARRLHADGYFNPNNPTDDDWEQGSGAPFAHEVSQTLQQQAPGLDGSPDMGEAAGGGEAAGAGELGEAAPLLLAANRQGGFSLDAFDRGEFSFGDEGGTTGEVRRVGAVGGGPRQKVRIDPGMRGHERQARTYRESAPAEDSFGGQEDPQLTEYGEPSASPVGADIVANFQRSAGALSMMHGQSEARPGSMDDFASSPMVRAMQKTAGRKFTPAEERELEQESHREGARNMPTQADLQGTHYVL